MARKKAAPANPHAKTPAELKAIRENKGVGDTPITPVVVPSDSTRRRRKKAAATQVETGPTFKPATGSERVSGEEDQGPSAAPKIQVKGPLVSTGKRLRQKGYRPAKNRELAKGIKAVTLSTEAPKTRKKSKRKTTRTGKPLDATGKIDTSKIKKGRIAKLDGKLTRVDDSNIEDIKKAAVTTVLPTAGPEAPARTAELPFAPMQVHEQGYKDSSPEHHESLKRLTAAAFVHLGRIKDTHGTDEQHTHHAAFNEVHAQVSNLDHSMGEILRTAHHAASNPEHPDSDKHLAFARQAAGARLGLGKATADARLERSRAGRAKRMEAIRAAQAAKEGNQ